MVCVAVVCGVWIVGILESLSDYMVCPPCPKANIRAIERLIKAAFAVNTGRMFLMVMRVVVFRAISIA